MLINEDTLSDLTCTLSTRFKGIMAAAPASEVMKIATRVGSSSKFNTYSWIGEMLGMHEWTDDRIVQQLKAHRYSIENRRFSVAMEGDLDEMRDDAGGLAPQLGSQAEILARAVARHPDELGIAETLVGADSLLCYDDQPFFDDSHPVGRNSTVAVSNDMGGSGPAWYLFYTLGPIKPLIYQVREVPTFDQVTNLNDSEVWRTHKLKWGAWCRDSFGFGMWQMAIRSKQTLNAANFKAARLAMENFTNNEGQNFGFSPNELWVPRSLRDTAKKLFGSEYLSVTGGSTENNDLFGAINVHVSNFLPQT